MQTKTRNGRKNGSRKTPELQDILGTKRGPGRPAKPAPTASQIADSCEAEAKKLQGLADILRGKA